jgi:hypothetical protein
MSRMPARLPELKNSVPALAHCFRSGGSQVHQFGQIQNPMLSVFTLCSLRYAFFTVLPDPSGTPVAGRADE